MKEAEQALESGFYWVRFEEEPWTVSEFLDGEWTVCGVAYDDPDFSGGTPEEIGPRIPQYTDTL